MNPTLAPATTFFPALSGNPADFTAPEAPAAEVAFGAGEDPRERGEAAGCVGKARVHGSIVSWRLRICRKPHILWQAALFPSGDIVSALAPFQMQYVFGPTSENPPAPLYKPQRTIVCAQDFVTCRGKEALNNKVDRGHEYPKELGGLFLVGIVWLSFFGDDALHYQRPVALRTARFEQIVRTKYRKSAAMLAENPPGGIHAGFKCCEFGRFFRSKGCGFSHPDFSLAALTAATKKSRVIGRVSGRAPRLPRRYQRALPRSKREGSGQGGTGKTPRQEGRSLLLSRI